MVTMANGRVSPVVAPKLCIFICNKMETTGVRQRMGIMHSDGMNTVFYSGDAWDSMP